MLQDTRAQSLQVKSTSLAHSLPSRQPAAATGAHNATQRQKLHVPPALKALKLQACFSLFLPSDHTSGVGEGLRIALHSCSDANCESQRCKNFLT